MVGIDLESTTRFEHLTDEGLKRYFTDNEIAYAKQYENWLEHLTGFYCVKEAFVKALDCEINYINIEVLHKETGKPYINETREIRKIMRENFLNVIDVSISHCKEFSTAVVTVEWQKRRRNSFFFYVQNKIIFARF